MSVPKIIPYLNAVAETTDHKTSAELVSMLREIVAKKLAGDDDVDVAEIEASASPESITRLAHNMSPDDILHLTQVLGIGGAFQAAAAQNKNVDVAVINAALAKTKLSVEDRIRLKLLLTESRGAGCRFGTTGNGAR
jgi:hypothetical protein